MNLENPPLIKVIYTLLSNDVVLRDDWMGVIRQIHSIEMIAKGIKKEDYFDILFDGKYDSFSNDSYQKWLSEIIVSFFFYLFKQSFNIQIKFLLIKKLYA